MSEFDLAGPLPAETTLLDVRCHDGNALEDHFAKAAREQSNCPSGAEGGHLGWLTPSDCAPEFAKELFSHAEIGVLPRSEKKTKRVIDTRYE